MFKFLRRYSKWILAFGGTLLLITFLVPYAFQGLGQAAVTRATWATIGENDETVTGAEQMTAQREMRIIELLSPQRFVGQVKIESAQHWYLLKRAAAEAGLIGGQEDALAMIPEPREDMINSLRSSSGEPTDFVLDSIAAYRGVFRMLSLFSSAGHFSDRRLKQEARELFHNVSAKFVVIPASAEQTTYEPTEEEIVAQFEAYADLLPGQGERGFGYKLPDRVKLEWLAIPAHTVRSTIEASPEFNDIALRKHWRANPDLRFPEVVDGSPIPEVVRTDLAQSLFTTRMEEIAREATDYLRAATRGLTRSGSFLVLPADWNERRPQFPQLAIELQNKFGIPLPAYTGIGDRWLTAQDINAIDGLGTATTDRFGTRPVTLGAMLPQLKEFGNPLDVVLQAGVAGPPLKSLDGSLYFFRVLETDASRRATDVDEVREMVIADLKRVADYEHLQATMTAIEAEAEQDNLLSLLITNPRAQFSAQQPVSLASVQSLMIQSQLGMPLSAMSTPLPVIGRDDDAVRAIIEYALDLPLVSVESMTPEQKILAVPVDNKLTLLIVEIVQNQPLTRELYNQAIDTRVIQQLLLNRELDAGQAILDTFSYDAMAKQYNFKPNVSETAEENGETEQTAAAATN